MGNIVNGFEYIKNPEKWFGTEEEEYLINHSIKHILTTTPRPTRINVKWKDKIISVINKNDDMNYLMLLKKVLEVYQDGITKRGIISSIKQS